MFPLRKSDSKQSCHKYMLFLFEQILNAFLPHNISWKLTFSRILLFFGIVLNLFLWCPFMICKFELRVLAEIIWMDECHLSGYFYNDAIILIFHSLKHILLYTWKLYRNSKLNRQYQIKFKDFAESFQALHEDLLAGLSLHFWFVLLDSCCRGYCYKKEIID